MNTTLQRVLVWSLAAWLSGTASAVALTGVNPTGVNINRHDVSTVFLTFQGTANEVPGAAFWCLRLNAAPNTVTRTNPCVPGSIIGTLPARLDLSRASGPQSPGGGEGDDLPQGRANTTDIMTIPPSVARRALQVARDGDASQFFYVREFIDAAGGSSFISVTCRMAGGGARTPFAITFLDIVFEGAGDRPVTFLAQGELAPALSANVRFTGSGRLRGRWEVVMPGEPLPSELDLLPAASLPVELRGLQKPYTVLSRFDTLLPPVGQFQLPGPRPESIPVELRGAYQVLLRLEATEDKEGASDTLTGVASSGGVAGFAMPVLRYFVGVPAASGPTGAQSLTGTAPADGATLLNDQPLYLSWRDELMVPRLRLELAQRDGPVFFSAIVPGGTGHYLVPRHVRDQAGTDFRWRMVDVETLGTRETPWTHARVLRPPER